MKILILIIILYINSYASLKFVDINGLDANIGSNKFPYKSVNYAISQSNLGDTIIVNSGKYYWNESLTDSWINTNIMVDKKIVTVIAPSGPESTLVCLQIENATKPSIFIDVNSSINIEGFTFYSGICNSNISTVSFNSSSGIFRNCRFLYFDLNATTWETGTETFHFKCYNSNVSFINCLFDKGHAQCSDKNYSTSIIKTYIKTINVINCTFVFNGANGYSSNTFIDGPTIIKNCIFANNSNFDNPVFGYASGKYHGGIYEGDSCGTKNNNISYSFMSFTAQPSFRINCVNTTYPVNSIIGTEEQENIPNYVGFVNPPPNIDYLFYETDWRNPYKFCLKNSSPCKGKGEGGIDMGFNTYTKPIINRSEPVSIKPIYNNKNIIIESNNKIYSIDGKLIKGKINKNGIYILNNKKILIIK